ncbi:MAG: 30S ribosomal protein S6 [Sedimentisphaeraceae bacterium JB056]
METKRLYECLLLIDPAIAASNWEGITGKVTSQIEKRGGEVVSLKKWDERQLAYDIDGKSRGTYILVYFKSEPAAIVAVERDFKLAEDIMRTMILRADFISSDEQMDKQAPTITDFRYRGGSSDEGWKGRDYKSNDDDDDDDDSDDDSSDDASEEKEAEEKTVESEG